MEEQHQKSVTTQGSKAHTWPMSLQLDWPFLVCGSKPNLCHEQHPIFEKPTMSKGGKEDNHPWVTKSQQQNRIQWWIPKNRE